MKTVFTLSWWFGFGVVMLSLSGCAAMKGYVHQHDTEASKSKAEKSVRRSPRTANKRKAPAPQIISSMAPIPKPRPYRKTPGHSVVVSKVPVSELLFSLARDANLNVDIDDRIDDVVTLNAINQPLETILERIEELADIRFTLKNNFLKVSKDAPFIKNYPIGYLNLARTSESSVYISTEISSTGQGANSTSSGGGNSNNSSTGIKNTADHNLWSNIISNIATIIEQPFADTGKEGGALPNHDNIIPNRETGVIAVRAKARQHKYIEHFLNQILASARRQVMIEATIAEVKLNDTYQAGIDWSLVKDDVLEFTSVAQTVTDITLATPPNFTLTLNDLDFGGDALQSTLSALETFGDVSIMSSPRVMALNNQTAMLKVVDNIVYFSVDVFIDRGDGDNSETFITYETEINSLPVGFVMSVTPFVDTENSVTLNIRPTISRVIGYARDPNPALAEVDVVSEIPIIQVREVESVLKVTNGNIAVIGGLMQDVSSSKKQGIPFLSRIPFLGPLFRYDDDSKEKTELVIFIKPVIMSNPNFDKNYKHYQKYFSKKKLDDNR